MSNETTQQPADPAPSESLKQPPFKAEFGSSGIEIKTAEDLMRLSTAISQSGLAPKGMERVQTIFVAIQMGLEIGLKPMQAIQSIAVINGRPSVWGDAALALVKGSGLMEDYQQEIRADGATVTVKRRGEPPISYSFTKDDAKQAGLLGKAGPWSQYPQRMMMLRARGFALRDAFPDVLKGVITSEEARDMEPIDVTPSKPNRSSILEQLGGPKSEA